MPSSLAVWSARLTKPVAASSSQGPISANAPMRSSRAMPASAEAVAS